MVLLRLSREEFPEDKFKKTRTKAIYLRSALWTLSVSMKLSFNSTVVVFLCLYDLKLFLKKQLATQRMIFPWLGILPRVQTAGPTILRKWNIPQKPSCLIFGVQIRTSWLTESIVHFWRIQGADGRRFCKWFNVLCSSPQVVLTDYSRWIWPCKKSSKTN